MGRWPLVLVLACRAPDVASDPPRTYETGPDPVPPSTYVVPSCDDASHYVNRGLGSVRVHAGRDLSGEPLLVMVGNPDGSWRYTATVEPGEVAELGEVPIGGWVTVVYRNVFWDGWYPATDWTEIESIGGVQDGDDLWFRRRYDDQPPIGRLAITADDPGVPVRELGFGPGTNCFDDLWNRLPPDEWNLWDRCLNARGGIDLYLQARRDDGPGWVVSAIEDLPITGTAPDLYGEAHFDQFELDPGVTRIVLENDTEEHLHGGSTLDLFHGGDRYRSTGRSWNIGWDDSVSSQLPALDGFIDTVVGHVSAEVGRDLAWRDEVLPVPTRGSTERHTVLASELPPYLPGETVDVDARCAAATWSVPPDCDGQPFTLGQLVFEVPSYYATFSWSVTGPLNEGVIRAPELDPAYAQLWPDDPSMIGSLELLAVPEESWDAIRTSPQRVFWTYYSGLRSARLDHARWMALGLVEGPICGVRSGPPPLY